MTRRSLTLLAPSLLAPSLLAVSTLLALPGCGTTPAAAPAANEVEAPAGDAAASIRALPEGQRTAVFLRAIRDAGRDCQGVTKAVEVTAAVASAAPGKATWQATCQDGGQWLVAIAADGAATVTNRADLREAGRAG